MSPTAVSLNRTAKFKVFDAPGVSQPPIPTTSSSSSADDCKATEIKKGGKSSAQGSRSTETSKGKIKKEGTKIGGEFKVEENPSWIKERNGEL